MGGGGGGGGGRGCFFTFEGFLRSRYRMGILFWAAKFQIFFGMPDIPVFCMCFFFLEGGGGGGKQ